MPLITWYVLLWRVYFVWLRKVTDTERAALAMGAAWADGLIVISVMTTSSTPASRRKVWKARFIVVSFLLLVSPTQTPTVSAHCDWSVITTGLLHHMRVTLVIPVTGI